MDDIVPKAEPRVLKYRVPSKIIPLSMMWLFWIFGLVLLVLGSLNRQPPLIRASCAGVFFGFIFFSIYWFIYRPKVLTEVKVLPDRISIQVKNRVDLILFKEIKELKPGFFMLQKSGLWIVMNSEKIYRFSPTLERLDYLLDGVYSARPDLISQETYQALTKKLVLSDHSVGRHFELLKFKNLFVTFSVVLLFSVIVCFFQSDEFVIRNPFSHIANLLALAFAPSFLVYYLTSYFVSLKVRSTVSRQMEINPSDRRCDIQAEKKLKRKTSW